MENQLQRSLEPVWNAREHEIVNFLLDNEFVGGRRVLWDVETSYRFRFLHVPIAAKHFLRSALDGRLVPLADWEPCTHCGGVLSVVHVLFGCTLAISVWQMMDFKLPYYPDSFSQLFNFLNESGHLDTHTISRFILVCYHLWKLRLLRVNPPDVVAKADGMLSSGRLETDFLGRMDSLHFAYPTDNSEWTLPPPGFLKLNIAGTCVDSASSTSVGAVLRDSNGHLIGAMVDLLPVFSGKKLRAVPLALRCSLRWLLADLNMVDARIIVEIPQGTIVGYMKGKSVDGFDVDIQVLNECVWLAQRFPSIQFQFCDEFDNQVARNLCRRAHAWDFRIGSWFKVAPPWMIPALRKDTDAAA